MPEKTSVSESIFATLKRQKKKNRQLKRKLGETRAQASILASIIATALENQQFNEAMEGQPFSDQAEIDKRLDDICEDEVTERLHFIHTNAEELAKLLNRIAIFSESWLYDRLSVIFTDVYSTMVKNLAGQFGTNNRLDQNWIQNQVRVAVDVRYRELISELNSTLQGVGEIEKIMALLNKILKDSEAVVKDDFE